MNSEELARFVDERVKISHMPDDKELAKMKKRADNWMEVRGTRPYAKCDDPNCSELHKNKLYKQGSKHCQECGHTIPMSDPFCIWCKGEDNGFDEENGFEEEEEE